MKNLAELDSEKLESVPNRSKMREGSEKRRHYRTNNIPYNRIHRFLNSRVGKSWDAVFSEFKTLEWMPIEHRTEKVLMNDVEKNTILKDGGVHYLDERYGAYRPINEGFYYTYKWNRFYIHPKTKVLCRREELKKELSFEERVKSANKKYFKILGHYHQLIKIKGIWHEVKGKPTETDYVTHNGLTYKYIENYVPSIVVESAQFEDATKKVNPKNQPTNIIFINGKAATPVKTYRYFEKKLNPRECLIKNTADDKYRYYGRVYGHEVKITLCRQLSKKELKRHGLSNDVIPLNTSPCNICGSFVPCWHSRDIK